MVKSLYAWFGVARSRRLASSFHTFCRNTVSRLELTSPRR
jgi:hypothetical protein